MHLVLLPGMNCSPALWAGVVGLLPEHVGPITPHMEGDSIDACVDHLLASLPDRFSLAGLSLGGIVAMALVRRAPERVERLALLDTNARPPTQAQRKSWAETLAQLDAGRTARDIQRDLLPVLLGPAAAADPVLVEATLAMADEVGAGRLADQLHMQATRVDERPALAGITVPTLVLMGDADALCPRDRHEEIANAIRGAHLVVVVDSGHLTPLERPRDVAHTLAGWTGRGGAPAS